MLVKGAIGVFPEEEYAYWLMNTLSWILPLMIILGAMVDVVLVYIYMRFAHPWKAILFYKDETSKMDENDIANESSVTEEGEERAYPEIIHTCLEDIFGPTLKPPNEIYLILTLMKKAFI